MTGTTVSAGLVPAMVERKAEDRTTSRVVTPNRLQKHNPTLSASFAMSITQVNVY